MTIMNMGSNSSYFWKDIDTIFICKYQENG